MTAPLFVFVHGWGFGPGVWDGVREALPEGESVAVDLGFYGPPSIPELPAKRPIVAVGHSFGALWLLHERPFAWDGLVLVNGFPRFTEGDGFAPATPRRLLDRMIARFDTAPEAVTADFLRRCGCEAPLPEGLDAARLGEALQALRNWDARATLTGPVLALAGGQDPIVPPVMTKQAFRDHSVPRPSGERVAPKAPGEGGLGEPDDQALRNPLTLTLSPGGRGDGGCGQISVEWHPDGGHLLPLTAPGWCAERIADFAARQTA
ncbi:alpha/beta fold hydrolase [Azospirillum brasilense]|uniref:alpha/beta fold hydrolase n=1 Tax=Azospirillum brasilense TaxID=192 RepID=UPI000E6A6CC0|nr:alpha/beta fold hydrolase [Azospirillum brasilense]NUB33243.1 alpha/beta hydrolase [Azospirillum brasilense]RIW02884.1 alpha/beta hydrolase [Azospirillum brasilense]